MCVYFRILPQAHVLPVHECDGDVADRQYQLEDEDKPARHLRSIVSMGVILSQHNFYLHAALA
jgi:hypothetical protein